MRTSILAITLVSFLLSGTLSAQTKRVAASAGRAEYIEVEKNVGKFSG